ncbi:MAG: sensor domain-containing diguanylate cyclase [Candidatus Acididesulfobacter guangdongensis]|uniref:Sensor domain-containing diguanylate cyclase n=1 Tax=Acididesulfobacter guangdongensis TaxID=2597225 RepID=A0A519BEX3_ACIG2|nr:MAG: sensor domain-containing diguanylate cyclase [Candidatus Acididesulfobacter guangdongensis]
MNIENNKNIFESIFQDSSAVMILIKEDGKIIDVNDAAVKFYGYSKEEFKTMYNYDFNTAPKDELIKYTRQAHNRERNYFEFIHKLKNGELKNVEVNASTINVGGKNYIISIIHDITEKKRAEEKLRESETLFKSLSINLTSGLILYNRKEIIFANPRAHETFGYSKGELLGLNPFNLINKKDQNEIHAGFDEDIRTAGATSRYILEGLKKDGSSIWLLWQTATIKLKEQNTRLATFCDITEMVNMRNQIESDKELFKTLIENMPLPVGIYKDKLLFVNPAAEKLFGYDKEEFYNKYVWEFFDENDKKFNKIKKSFGKIKNKERFISKYIVRCKKKDGSIIYANFFEMSIVYNGEIAGFGVIHDITDEVLEKRLISEEKEAYKELSEIDELTKIGNRRAFDKKLEELLNAADRYGRALSLIMFDIDRFKDVNDGFGHEIGDYILKEITKLIKRSLRNTDYFFRYGGEEFMIISPETPLSTAKELAERLRLKIEEHDFNIETSLTCSFGITEAVKGDTNASIIFRVDGALYNAKNTGRNKVSWE